MFREDLEKALREAYNAFYELPYKSTKMFDAMDDAASKMFIGEKFDDESAIKTIRKFFEAFENNARTEEQKTALSALDTVLLLEG